MLATKKSSSTSLEKSFDSLLEGCQIISSSYTYLYINSTAAKQSQHTKKELLGSRIMDVFPNIEKTKLFFHLQDCIEKRTFHIMEEEFTLPNGKQHWFELRIEPVPEGALILSVDITERKHTESKLRETLLLDEAILASITEGLIMTDQYGKTAIVNRSAQRMLGYPLHEILGKPLTSWLPLQNETGNIYAQHMRPITKILKRNIPITNTTAYYLRKNGEKIPVNITITPLIIDGMFIGAIEIFRDISKEKAVDKAKTEFVSVASHALRTPLGITKWYLEAISGENYLYNAPHKLQIYFNQIYKNNERLLTLVRNLLSVSRIDEGKITNKPQKINILEYIKVTVKDLQIAALKNQISINLSIRNENIPPLFLDPLRFRQVIENLISNAIKYTITNKRISVIVDKKVDTLLIRIKDQGIGISEEDKKKIFSKFFRGEKAIFLNTEGSGLGLYVTKSYIESWHGTLLLRSKEGKGSTFTIELPLNLLQKHTISMKKN